MTEQEDEQEAQERKIKDEIIADAAVYEDMLLTPGFKRLEEAINKKLSMEITQLISADTTDEQALKSRHFARGLQNVIDTVYNTIDTARKIKQSEIEEADEAEGG